MTQPQITDAALKAGYDALSGHGPEELEYVDQRQEAVRLVADAAAPHIGAQALRTYADQQHPHAVGHARRVEYGTGIEHDTECAGCGSSWNSDEGGCTERVELLRAANALVTPPVCNCHETGASCNCADEFQETR